jgi:PAS domain S-box-containing protein
LNSPNSEAFIRGIAEATNILISKQVSDVGIRKAMKVLKSNLNTEACFVLEVEEKVEAEYNPENYWLWLGGKGLGDVNKALVTSTINESIVALSKGTYIELRHQKMLKNVQLLMESIDSQSLILFPILVEGDFWGVFGVSDLQHQEDWSESEKLLFQSFSNSIGGLLARNIFEHQLTKKERQLRSLVFNLPGIVYRCKNDKDWSMLYISPATEELTGYLPDEFYGQSATMTFSRLILPSDIDEVANQIAETLREKRPYRVIYRIRTKSGDVKWLWEQGVGVPEEEGVSSILEGCIFDITPMVKNEEKVKSAIYSTEEKERMRISSEIHDGLQQTLSVGALNLQYLEREKMKLSDEAQKRLENSLIYLDKGIKETRTIAHQLMPRNIKEVGLKQVLMDLVAEIQEIHPFKLNFYSNLEVRLNEKIELAFYRVAQSALTNTLKYAEAKNVHVQLVNHDGEVQLMIEDDGKGFNKNEIDIYHAGFGLTSMKNRMEAISGSILIDSKLGHGTNVIAKVVIE